MKKHISRKPPKKIKHQKKKLYKKTFAVIITLVLSILLGLVISSFYGTEIDEVTKDIKSIATIDIEHLSDEEKNKNNITYEEKTRALEIGYVDNADNNLYLETTKPTKDKKNIFHFEEPNLEEIDKKDENKIEEPVITTPQIIEELKKKEIIEDIKETKIVTPISNKPKLAILIDDVTTKRQIESIKNIGYIVNMAFLPPTSGHKNSAKITDNLDLYMIHLPLQASSSKYEEENTLYINHSIEKIDERIKNLKALYPKAVFINNHTGSKFTSNQVAMDKLFQVLKKYNYNVKADGPGQELNVIKDLIKKINKHISDEDKIPEEMEIDWESDIMRRVFVGKHTIRTWNISNWEIDGKSIGVSFDVSVFVEE